jgi:hypothetical protein
MIGLPDVTYSSLNHSTVLRSKIIGMEIVAAPTAVTMPIL